MSAPREPALDVRHWELAEKLRTAPPRPSSELRERVLALASSEPPPRPRRIRAGRLALALAPVAAVVLVLGVVGLRGERAPEEAASVPKASTVEPDRGAFWAAPSRRAEMLSSAPFAPGSTRRLQSYQADLRVRVDGLDDLGNATQQAMRTTRGLGGYVVVADYGAPGRRNGESLLVVRVPVGRVQQAIFRFSELGAIVSQRIHIQDLQAGFSRLERRIVSLRRTVAELQARLADDHLTPEQRAQLRVQLLAARQDLARTLRTRDATLRQGRLARVELTLTTRGAAAVTPHKPGYFERTLRDALSVVGKVLVWTLYVLIVASPFLALALLAWLGERARRRRADERLLERASA